MANKVPQIFKTLFPNWFQDTATTKSVVMGPGSDKEGKISAEVLFSSQKRLWEFYSIMTSVMKDKMNRVQDYEEMIRDPINMAAIELLSEDSFQMNDGRRSLTVNASGKIKKNTEQFLDEFNIEELIAQWAFDCAFYGEVPIRVQGSMDQGITSLNSDIHPLDFYRLQSGSLFAFLTNYDRDDQGKMNVLPPWEMVHMFYKRQMIKKRLEDSQIIEIGKKKIILDAFEVIGFLEPVRGIWKKLRLAEDSMVLARLDRAPMKRVFYIDVGDADPSAKIDIINEFKKNYKEEVSFAKDMYYDSKSNPLTFGQELFIPISEGIKNIEVSEYGGQTEVAHIVDVEYLRAKYFAGIKTNKNFLGMCLRGITAVKLLNGSTPTIKDMFENQSKYLGQGVYTCSDSGKIGASPITQISSNRKNTNFVRVLLDNGESFDVTPDHPCQMREGSFIEAQFLKEGDSLMPLYTSVRRGGYRWFKDNESLEWSHVHRMVGNYLAGGEIPEGFVTHHKNRDKLDNSFDNLVNMSKIDHGDEHRDILSRVGARQRTQAEIESLSMRDRSYMKGVNNVMRDPEIYQRYLDSDRSREFNWTQKPEYKEKMKGAIAKAQELRWPGGSSKVEYEIECNCCGRLFRRRLSEHEVMNGYFDKPRYCSVSCQRSQQASCNLESIKDGIFNHRVVSVEWLDVIEDAYDLTVESSDHCFALGAGVFVHNTEDLPGSLGESALVRLEIRYARTVKHLRRGVMNAIFRMAQIHNGYLGEEVTRKTLTLDANYISTAEEEEQRDIFKKRIDSAGTFIDFLEKVGMEMDINNQEFLKFAIYDLLKMADFDLEILQANVENPGVMDDLKKFISERRMEMVSPPRGDEVYETPLQMAEWKRRFEGTMGSSEEKYDIKRELLGSRKSE